MTVFSTNCNIAKKDMKNAKNNIKVSETAAIPSGTYWKLIELTGKPIKISDTSKKKIHIKFIEEGNRVEGFGGCNGFAGNYTTKNNFNILITNIISTMIACPELETENELFNVLKTADNYYVKGRYPFT